MPASVASRVKKSRCIPNKFPSQIRVINITFSHLYHIGGLIVYTNTTISDISCIAGLWQNASSSNPPSWDEMPSITTVIYCKTRKIVQTNISLFTSLPLNSFRNALARQCSTNASTQLLNPSVNQASFFFCA